jgi:stage II sporulation protein D
MQLKLSPQLRPTIRVGMLCMPALSASLATAAALLAAPASQAATPPTKLAVEGAGFGHGVGMSQYGAYGFARRGTGYPAILAHYYRGTRLGTTSPRRTIRVILQANQGAVRFSGATAAGGRRLNPRVAYRAVRRGNAQVELQTGSGRRLQRFAAPLRATGPGAVRLLGGALNGLSASRYRGALEVRPARGSGINAINALFLDDYVAGVVAGEVPSSWPREALRAQAVAARTYAITTDAGGAGFDQWPDTRSQVYRGLAGEAATTNAAVRATAGQVVTYRGRPATTFFFSTSGGRTENVEHSFLGSAPRPWLRSVPDPYDGASPKHRWRITLSLGEAERRLGDLVKGRLRGIEVIKRGASPRVVHAIVASTGGKARATGPQLRARLGLFDTWATFAVR